MNRQQFFSSAVDKCTWVDIGSSYLASELGAAFLCARLGEADTITKKRRRILNLYLEHLQPLAPEGTIRLSIVPSECEHNAHTFHILVRDLATRTGWIAHLREHGIHAVFHYVPLHTSPMREGSVTSMAIPPSLRTWPTGSGVFLFCFGQNRVLRDSSQNDQEHGINEIYILHSFVHCLRTTGPQMANIEIG
jgi:hypothetical protein